MLSWSSSHRRKIPESLIVVVFVLPPVRLDLLVEAGVQPIPSAIAPGAESGFLEVVLRLILPGLPDVWLEPGLGQRTLQRFRQDVRYRAARACSSFSTWALRSEVLAFA